MASLVQFNTFHDPLQFPSNGKLGQDHNGQPVSSPLHKKNDSAWTSTIWAPRVRDSARLVVGQGRSFPTTLPDAQQTNPRPTPQRSTPFGNLSPDSAVADSSPTGDRVLTNAHDWMSGTVQNVQSRKSSGTTRSSTSHEGTLATSDLVAGSTVDGEIGREPAPASDLVLKQWSTAIPFQPSRLYQNRFDTRDYLSHTNNFNDQNIAIDSVPTNVNGYHSDCATNHFVPPKSAYDSFHPNRADFPNHFLGPNTVGGTEQTRANHKEDQPSPVGETLSKNLANLSFGAIPDPFYARLVKTEVAYNDNCNAAAHGVVRQPFKGETSDHSHHGYRPSLDELFDHDQSIHCPRWPSDDGNRAFQAAYNSPQNGVGALYSNSSRNIGNEGTGWPRNGHTGGPPVNSKNNNDYKSDWSWGMQGANSSRANFHRQYPRATLSNGTGQDFHKDMSQFQPPVYNYTSQSRDTFVPGEAKLYRSSVLEDYRLNHKTKRYELQEIYDHIVEFSGDQHGSRFIQHRLEIASGEEKERVFQEIEQDCRQLMTDVFGNYVIQKMFEHGNQAQKMVLADQMRGQMLNLSTQMYGCRVVQKALEHILTDQQASLIKELDGQVLQIVGDQNGNHVIQKAIERIPGEHIQFIVDAHRGHVHELSKHAYGCRVIQRMLEHCNPRAKRQILDELHLNIGDLIQDPFGNYVVQHVIINGELRDRKPVIEKVCSRLIDNAKHKFASNVVEKAIEYAEEGQRQMLLTKLVCADDLGKNQVRELLGHQYGNYVIQKCAAHLQGPVLQFTVDEMEHHLLQLRRINSGRQVSALENTIREARRRLSPIQTYVGQQNHRYNASPSQFFP